MAKVLIIEDEINTAIPVKEALSLHDVEADIAKDGSTGLNMFKSKAYDLILLDLKMPGMSGEDVLKQIRQIDPFIDVIVYTNYRDFSDIKKLTNIGIDGYINKGPTADLSELIDSIRSKLAPLVDDDIEKLVHNSPPEMFENK